MPHGSGLGKSRNKNKQHQRGELTEGIFAGKDPGKAGKKHLASSRGGSSTKQKPKNFGGILSR